MHALTLSMGDVTHKAAFVGTSAHMRTTQKVTPVAT